jgi:hypothetical protein
MNNRKEEWAISRKCDVIIILNKAVRERRGNEQ